jgi:hypothetical protein
MSVVYCPGVGWASLLAFWTNDVGEDGVDISVSGGGGLAEFDPFDAEQGHTALAAAITQLHVIGGANAVMGVSADPAVFALPAVPGTMGHTVAAPGLVQQHNLTAVVAEMIHNADSAVQGVVIAALAAVQGHTADTVVDIEQEVGAMGVGSPIMGEEATPAILVKNIAVISPEQGHTADPGIFPLSVGPAAIGNWMGGLRLTQQHNLTSVDGTMGNVAGG